MNTILENLLSLSYKDIKKTLFNMDSSVVCELMDYIETIDYNCAKIDTIYQIIDEEGLNNIEEEYDHVASAFNAMFY